MTIPADSLNKWKALRTKEDSQTIANSIKVSDETINRAFRDGKCSERVFEAMAKHYKAKSNRLKKLLK